jgi:DnaJ-class molecular chaperone
MSDHQSIRPQTPTQMCPECGGTGEDHPCSYRSRNSEFGADCPKCKGTGHWTRDGIPIPGQHSTTYTVQPEDTGKTIAFHQ